MGQHHPQSRRAGVAGNFLRPNSSRVGGYIVLTLLRIHRRGASSLAATGAENKAGMRVMTVPGRLVGGGRQLDCWSCCLVASIQDRNVPLL